MIQTTLPGVTLHRLFPQKQVCRVLSYDRKYRSWDSLMVIKLSAAAYLPPFYLLHGAVSCAAMPEARQPAAA